MSTPENILAKYRTYSYHHVLIACGNTQVVEELSQSLNMYEYLYETGEARRSKKSTKSGDYVVIANGLSDSDFIIDEVKWISVIAPQPSSESKVEQFASFAVEGSMVVTEPRGVDFLNVLSGACDTLETDPTGLVFMLKTFFVGDTDGRSVDYITSIKPIAFIMTDIASTFDVIGSVYSIEFVSVTNGAAKLPQIVNGADRVSLKLAGTIGESLKKFQNEIMRHYDAHYKKMETAAEESNQTFTGQKVEYIIEIAPDTYQDYKVDQPPEFLKDKGLKEGEGSTMGFGQNPSIESAIMDILKTSKQFGDDAVGKNDDKKKYIPKIQSTIKSGISEGKSYYQVIYKVGRSEVPVSTLSKIHDEDQNFVKEGNAMIFDYFFSGKNTDILDFNIQMQMGLMFFQTVSTAESILKSQGENELTSKSQGVGSNSAKSTNTKSGPRTKTPLLFSTIVKKPKQKNVAYPLASTDFQSLLARHAAIEMLEAKIKIVGNPLLMNSMIQLPSDVIKGPNPSPRTGREEDIFNDWTSTPSLVKVNIFMPSNDQDGDFAKRFWYDGWYYVTGIEHMFSGGEFTQTIEMLSLPLEQYLTVDDPDPKTANTSEGTNT
jgi:hypothetical protein